MDDQTSSRLVQAIAQLEPAVVELRERRNMTPTEVAALSIAISLKRLADAREKADEPREHVEMAPSEEEIAARPNERIARAFERIANVLTELHSPEGESKLNHLAWCLGDSFGRGIDHGRGQ